MYCKRCYAELHSEPANPAGVVDGTVLEYATQYDYACRECGRRFDPNRPRTYLVRRFPSVGQIIMTLFWTTLFGIVCAWVVSFHQMAAMSGH